MHTLRRIYLAAELAGNDQKIKEAEAQLLQSIPAEELHRIVDELVALREQHRYVEAMLRTQDN